MWVFDGEQWIGEGGTNEETPRGPRKQYDMEQYDMDRFLPELQVVEVVPTVPQANRVPFPLP